MNDPNDSSVLIERRGNVALITLNRPHALNALTHEMILMISAKLSVWQGEPNIKAVFFIGAGDRAFCAGGDIKHAYNMGLAYKKSGAAQDNPDQYFYDEYNLNRQLYHYKKPLFAFMDGVTMGGGFGVAGPCDFRIATEKTVFAMPEVGIGFFPDIGGVHYLLQSHSHIGEFLCLTGHSVSGFDALYAGIATHIVAFENKTMLISELIDVINSDSSIDGMMKSYEPVGHENSPIKDHRDIICDCFALDDPQEIISALIASGDEWAKNIADLMLARSPLSMKVTMEHIKRSEGQSFDQVIARDFNLAQQFLKGEDFYEGVRAAVIDKDRNPQWQHKSLADVSDEEVEQYFSAASRTLY